jgi:hypothetical protein
MRTKFHTEGTAKALASRISATGGYEFNSAALCVPYVVT